VAPFELEINAPLKGRYAARMTSGTTGVLYQDMTATGELFVSFYFRPDGPATGSRIVLFSWGQTSMGGIVLSGAGLQLKNGSTVIGNSVLLTTGTLYRIGLRQKAGAGNGVLEAFVATNDAPFGAPFASSSSESFSASIGRASFGATNAVGMPATFDDIRIDSGSMPPTAGGLAPTSTMTPSPTATNTPVPSARPIVARTRRAMSAGKPTATMPTAISRAAAGARTPGRPTISRPV
jgi:hypothetical protein